MQTPPSTTEQINNLIEFRQAVYAYGLTKARDAQMELVDSLLCNQRVNSFVELSLAPTFQRGWASAYAAIEDGEQDVDWLHRHVARQPPRTGDQVFALDTTFWEHPRARTLPGMVYYRPGRGQATKIGHIYSLLSWVQHRGGSWAPPIDTQRMQPDQTPVAVGVEQVKALCQQRRHRRGGLDIIVADGAYGNHRFFGLLKDEPCAIVARLRRDRVLYSEPGPYSGRGRPRVHGERFAFKEPETWQKPDENVTFVDERWGHVRLRRWNTLHAKQDATTPFDVVLAEVHCEREQPPAPIWLGYQGPAERSAHDIWFWFDHRWVIEPSIRFRKQYLHWNLPAFQCAHTCDRWTRLVDVSYWLVFLARDCIRDRPMPWQQPQPTPTPERVLQSFGPLFATIGTPVRPVRPRGKSPGWPQGRPRRRPKRYKPVKRGRKRAKSA